MSSNYDNLANRIVEGVGGVKNVAGLTHCVTRLRFKLIDSSKANKEAIGKLTGVLTVVEGNGQLQIVIGNAVSEVFDTILCLHPMKIENTSSNTTEETKGNPLSRVFTVMASIFSPIVTALAGAGMLKALLVILTTTLGVLDKTGSTYKILSAAGNSVFYFLPLFLAVSSANAFKCNPFISLAIVAALQEPNFTGLMTAIGDVSGFMGIPVVLMGYSGTVIPAILSIYVYSKLEKILKRMIPKSIELFTLSLAALLIMVPLTMIVIGPIGVYLGNGMGEFINFLSAKTGLLTGLIIGAGWTFLVMMGIHWGIVPLMVNNIATYGFDFIRPMVAAATFASAGVAIGVFLKSKNKENKAFALSAAIPALLGGITEPIIYGLSVKYKKPLIAQVIGGGIAGAFMGAMHTKAFVYVFPALTTLPAFFGDTFIYYATGITMSLGITAALTYILGFDEVIPEEIVPEEESPASEENKTTVKQSDGEEFLYSCITGDIVKLENVNDAAFSSKSLGVGVAFIPKEGALYAPIDGTIEAVFPTHHAIGMTTENGAEILLHIGINTVELQGKYFEGFVKQGQKVEQGQLLVQFDPGKIKEAGYDTTTVMLVTNASDMKDVVIMENTSVEKGNKVLLILKK